MSFEQINFQALPGEDVTRFADILNEELGAVVIPAEADEAARTALVNEAKARARDRFAAHMAPKLQAEADAKKAKAEAEEAERKRTIAEAWANWERLDDVRTAALQVLEDAFKAAVIASSQAAIAYPADRSVLPKRYSTSPEKVESCGALAKSQSEMIRKLRDKANEVNA